jgi:hypothetical protein
MTEREKLERTVFEERARAERERQRALLRGDGWNRVGPDAFRDADSDDAKRVRG